MSCELSTGTLSPGIEKREAISKKAEGIVHGRGVAMLALVERILHGRGVTLLALGERLLHGKGVALLALTERLLHGRGEVLLLQIGLRLQSSG